MPILAPECPEELARPQIECHADAPEDCLATRERGAVERSIASFGYAMARIDTDVRLAVESPDPSVVMRAPVSTETWGAVASSVFPDARSMTSEERALYREYQAGLFRRI